MQRLRFALVLAAALPLAAQPAPVKSAFDEFRASAIRAHTKFLSSDLLEGRGPGTRGDELATGYAAAQFEAMGLDPAGDNGSYFQKVSLLGITTVPEKTTVAFKKNGSSLGALVYRDEFVGGSQTQKEADAIDSEVVFVGHGVVAPEFGWDDYKGLDVRGKTLVMLVDDPPASKDEPQLFGGRARTYYGRWTYKYEIAAERGAQAVILVHTNEAAGYGWQVVRNSWTGEQAYVKLPEGKHALAFAGWLTSAKMADVMKAAGHDLAALTEAAHRREFKPVPLGVRLTGSVTSTIRPFDTSNVVAKLAGSDPQLKDEAVVYSAHHDHIGIGTPDDDDATDTIYNGAVDNASGTAAILEIARVWSETEPRPRRSIIFALVAAEEQGLLGSEYFGANPVVPAGKIALGLNLDALNMWGEVKTVTMVGAEKLTFYPAIERVAKAMNLSIVPDRAPEQGSFYRSDHFSFAKAGIPAFSIKQGSSIAGKPDGWGEAKSKLYGEKHYHQASDEFDPEWNFAGTVQVSRLAYWIGWEAAQAEEMPMWRGGEEFYAKTAEVRRKK